MNDKDILVGEHGILEVVGEVAAKGLSGRLEIAAGAVAGALAFINGKLVDARVGHLTGFQAMNAIASLRDARVRFDRSAAPPMASSITANEQVVLKQFFGIESVSAHEYSAPIMPDYEYSAPILADERDEATVITSDLGIPHDEIAHDELVPIAAPVGTTDFTNARAQMGSVYQRHPRAAFVAVFALCLLVAAVAAAAVTLRHQFRERTAVAAVTTSTEPGSSTEPISPTEPVSSTEQASAPVSKNENATNTLAPAEAKPVENPDAAAESAKVQGAVTESGRENDKLNSSEAKARQSQTASTSTQANTSANDRPTKRTGDLPQASAKDLRSAAAKDVPSESAHERAADAPDLTGKWTVVNTVQTTAYGSFANLQIGFTVAINQTGRTFTATGRKISENGRVLPAASRTPIQLKGVINGDSVEATFSEQGAMRNTSGRIVWKLDRTGGLRGTFASSAARSSGQSAATREL